MFDQLGLPDERARALGTLERLDPRVHRHVKVELVFPPKGLAAFGARKPPDVFVDLNVAGETVGGAEAFAADLTQELLGHVVETGFVVGQVDLLDEPLGAFVAPERLLGCLVVFDQMLLQRGVQLEVQRTFRTLKRPLVLVFFCFVSDQKLFGFERLGAQFAVERAAIATTDMIFHATRQAVVFVAVSAAEPIVNLEDLRGIDWAGQWLIAAGVNVSVRSVAVTFVTNTTTIK